MTAKPRAHVGPLSGWTSSDEELVARCLTGDQEAWADLVEKYKELVWSVPLRYRLRPEDCADIFQGVWLDLFAELKNLRRAQALPAWLITTAAHRCYHWKRRLHSHSGSGASPADWNPEDNHPSFLELRLEFERQQMLREALALLPERCREMMDMLFYQEPARPYDEVARNLGLAVGSIGFIRGRCLKKLRALLEEMNF